MVIKDFWNLDLEIFHGNLGLSFTRATAANAKSQVHYRNAYFFFYYISCQNSLENYIFYRAYEQLIPISNDVSKAD